MTYPFRVIARSSAQRGAVLMVALIFLLLITILAVAASGNSLLQLRLAGGLRSSQLADFGAESALRGAEWRLWTATGTSNLIACTTSGPLCYSYDASQPNATVETFRNSKGWVSAGSTTYAAGTLTASSTDKTFQLSKDPVYIIEDLGLELPPGIGTQHESGQSSSGAGNTGTDSHVYRVTARSTGPNPNTVRVIETTFAAKVN